MENFQLESLSEKNCQEIYEFCERKTQFWTFPYNIFKRFMLNDPNFNPDLTIIARQGGKLVGFIVAAKRRWMTRTRAIIKAIVIAREFRRKGYGTGLMHELKNRLKVIKLKKIDAMCGPPDYWFPGVDVRHTAALFFFKRNNFHKRGQRINLSVDLSSPTLDQPPEARRENIIFSRATLYEKGELSAFVQRHFGLGSWPEETLLAFENDPITNFIARDTITGALVGWATHSCGYFGSFGPTGVLKETRNQGIGGDLLRWCMFDQKTKFNQKEMTIRWVTGNTVKFYSKAVGAYISQVFWVMRARV
ncbi:MAG: N-acetyltransferase GCN5 [Promethearchaeota archaeon CR_4]|nr:MAG: N-acetyltransferase GCN5 [Candidatus Lokiarchaeota archaeon CR_4]